MYDKSTSEMNFVRITLTVEGYIIFTTELEKKMKIFSEQERKQNTRT